MSLTLSASIIARSHQATHHRVFYGSPADLARQVRDWAEEVERSEPKPEPVEEAVVKDWMYPCGRS